MKNEHFVRSQFRMKVRASNVRGLFGGKGTITGTVMTGVVFSGDTLSVFGKDTKPYRVESVSVAGESVLADAGKTVRLEVKGIRKKDLTPGDILYGDHNARLSPLVDAYEYMGEAEDYFAEVFARYFPDYDVRRRQTVRSTDGSMIEVDFLFYLGGNPCLAIFLRDSTEWKKKEVNYIETVCRDQSIGALTFIPNFRNTVDYVRDRVGKELS